MKSYESVLQSANMFMTSALMAVATALLILATAITARAHGEDAPGPNGGEIRMPGAFHTEVKVQGSEIHVYLLDMEFKNPVVENSSVEVTIHRGAKKTATKLECRASKAASPARFTCLASKFTPADGDVLKVKAKRGAFVGNDVEYTLPLLKAGAAKKDAQPAGSSHDPHHGHTHGH